MIVLTKELPVVGLFDYITTDLRNIFLLLFYIGLLKLARLGEVINKCSAIVIRVSCFYFGIAGSSVERKR